MELFEALNYTSSFGSNHGASLQGSLYSPFTVSCTDQADYWLSTDHLVLHASHFTDHVARAAPVARVTIQSAQFSPLLHHTLRGNLRNMLVLKLPSLYCRNGETALIRAHETIQGLLSVAVVSWTAGPRQQRECSHGVKLEAELQTIHR